LPRWPPAPQCASSQHAPTSTARLGDESALTAAELLVREIGNPGLSHRLDSQPTANPGMSDKPYADDGLMPEPPLSRCERVPADTAKPAPDDRAS
jgi:hypothetical protein